MALQGIQSPTFGGAAPAPVDRAYATPGTAPGAAPVPGATPTAPKAAAPAPTTPGPTPLPNLSTDPSFLALTRSLGLSDADAQAAAQQATARVGARLNNSLDQSRFAGGEADRRLSGGMEARGLLNSGEALRNLAVQRTQQGYREEAMRQAAASQLEALTTQLAMSQQGGQARLAELGLSAAPAIDINAGLAAQPLP